MTPQAQRIAIAEACGWTNISEVNPPDGSGSFWVGINKVGHECFLPDYLSDLNAMHEAEKTLTLEQCGNYWKEIFILQCRYHETGIKPSFSSIHIFPLLTTPAKPRAEAFLRTLSLWDDTK